MGKRDNQLTSVNVVMDFVKNILKRESFCRLQNHYIWYAAEENV